MSAPITFEQYVANWQADARRRAAHTSDECTSCCRKRKKLLTRDGYCEACLRYAFGYDQAEETVVTALLGGAVRALLATDSVDVALIRRAVDEAIDAERDERHGETLNAFARTHARAS